MPTQKEYEKAERARRRAERELQDVQEQTAEMQVDAQQMFREVADGVELASGAVSGGLLTGLTDSQIPRAVVGTATIAVGMGASSKDVRNLGTGMMLPVAADAGQKFGAWLREKIAGMLGMAAPKQPEV